MITIRLIAMVAVLVFVAACGSDDKEEPKRPPITRPLDAGLYSDRPCELLPWEDASRLGYTPPGTAFKAERSSAPEGYRAFCDFSPPKSPSLSFYLYIGHDELAYRYRNSKGAFIAGTGEPWLEPFEIGGQPAAWIGRSQQKPNDFCQIVIGLTDTQSVEVRGFERYPNPQHYRQGQGDGRACEYALGVAEAIVRNLGG